MVAKAYQVEHCYIPRLCVSREASQRQWYKEQLFRQLNWILLKWLSLPDCFPSMLPRKLPYASAPWKYCHDKCDLLPICSTLCGRVMSHVSMWWWAERKWRGFSQRTGSQKKKTQGKKGEDPSLKSNINSRTCPYVEKTVKKSRWLSLPRVN